MTVSLKKIVDGGFCIGCGACTCATDGGLPTELNLLGMYQVNIGLSETIRQDLMQDALHACPFSDDGPNEDEIGKRLFDNGAKYDSSLGFYRALYAGHVFEGNYRDRGASGGVITWVLTELKKNGIIDSVVHVRKVENPGDGVLFRYTVSSTEKEILSGAKSRYYPIEMSEVLNHIKTTPGRYALVGLPCFIKAARRLSEIDDTLKERIVVYIGIVCGHLKSKAFAECFAWQAGIPPGDLKEIDFRVKLPGRSAGDYGVYLRGSGKEVTRASREFLGSNWGHNFFRYSACDFCDDIFGETADISIGDAWLPEYSKDYKGNSVVVVRDLGLQTLISSACNENRLAFSVESPSVIATSQRGGLRDRREGLAYRLHQREKRRLWAPKKRIQPKKPCTLRQIMRGLLYNARSRSGAASHLYWKDAVLQGELSTFFRSMKPFIRQIDMFYLPGKLPGKIVSRIKSISRRLAFLMSHLSFFKILR